MNKDISIRLASIADYLFLKENDQHISDEVLKKKIENEEIFIIQTHEQKLGWLRYNLFWDNVPFMTMLYILEEHRNKGLGTCLVKFWEEDMRNKSYINAMTSTLSNEEAQHFYRKIGYKDIGSLIYELEPLEIILLKKL